MENRVRDSVSVMYEQGFGTLARFVTGRLNAALALQLESQLSLKGFRGPYWMPGNGENTDKTLRRRLRRAVMLSSLIRHNIPTNHTKNVWNKNKTTPELRGELARLQGQLQVPQGNVRRTPPPVPPRPNLDPITPPPITIQPARNAETLIRENTGGRLWKKVGNKWYYWLKQATNPDEAITDAGIAEARGWVPETMAGVPTGRYVAEDGGDSCGPTAVAIANHYITGIEIAEDRMREVAAQHPLGYHADGVGTGTFVDALAHVLNHLGNGVPTGWVKEFGPVTEDWVRTYVKKRKPVIFNVGWHFSVGVDIVGDNLICADPWFGPTEVPLNNLPDYPQIGKAFNGWVVYNPLI